MGGFSVGDLHASLTLDSGQYELALEQSAAASALLRIDIQKISDSVKGLSSELVRTGFSTKEFQGYLNSLRQQGLSTAESLTVLGSDLQALQTKVSAYYAQQQAESMAALRAKNAEIDAQRELDRQKILGLLKRQAVEKELDADAALRRSEMIARDYAVIVEREAAEKASAARRVSIEAGADARRAEIMSAELARADTLIAERTLAEKAAADARVAIEAGASSRRTGILAAELARAEALYLEEEAARKAASAGSKGVGGIGLGLGSGGLNPSMHMAGGPIALGAVAVLGAAEMAKEAAQLEDALAKVKAIIGDVSKDMSDKMAVASLDLAAKVGISAKEIVSEFGTMSKAEVSMAEQFKMLPVMAEFAVATNTDLAKSTKLVLTVMNTLKIPFSDASHVTDMFTAANRLAIGSVDDFAKALEGRAGAALRASKVPLSEALAMTVAFARGGVESSIAQTAITQTTMKLISSVEKHGEVVLRVGKEQLKWKDIVYQSNGELKKTYEIFQTLDKAFEGQSTEKINQFFQAIGVAGQRDVYVKSLLGMGNALEEVNKQIGNIGPDRMKAFGDAMSSPVQQFKILKEEVRNVAIELGEGMLPTGMKAIEVLTGVAGAARDTIKAFKSVKEDGSIPATLLENNALNLTAQLEFYLLLIEKYREGLRSMSNVPGPTPTSPIHKNNVAGYSIMNDVVDHLTAKDKKVETPKEDLFKDPAEEAKKEAKRLAAADKAYRITQQEITNEEQAGKDKLRLELLNETAIEEVDEESILRKTSRLQKYHDDVLALTLDANRKRLEAEKGKTGELTDLRLEGSNAGATAARDQQRVELEQQAAAKIRALQLQDAKDEARIRKQQDEEERRLETAKVNDRVQASQLELQAIYEHGTKVLELAKKRAAFDEEMGNVTKAQRIKKDREIEEDEYELQKKSIEREIAGLDERQNRIGQKDEAIFSKKQSLENRLAALKDGHSAHSLELDQEEARGLDEISQAMVRLEVEQKKLALLGNQSDRLIELDLMQRRTDALVTSSKGLSIVYEDLGKSLDGMVGGIGRTLAGGVLNPEDFTKNWKSALHSIETDLLGSFFQSFIKMGTAQLTLLLKIGVQKKAAGAADIATIHAVSAAQIAADSAVATARAAAFTASATSIAEIASFVALDEIFTQAAVGGAAAMASIAAIPIVGPALAPAAGEGMYDAIIATFAPRATFEHGGDVPRDMVALVHGGEHVIGPDLTASLKKMVAAGGGSNSSSVNFDFSGTTFGPKLTRNDVRGIMTEVVGELRRSNARTHNGKL